MTVCEPSPGITRPRVRRPNQTSKKFSQEINGYAFAGSQATRPHQRPQERRHPPRVAHGSIAESFQIETETVPMSAARKMLLGHGWGFAWPNDCRIIYNRASARPDGRPWSERKKLVWWDEEKKQWTGLDNADYEKEMPPDTPAEPARWARHRRPWRSTAIHLASGRRRLALRRRAALRMDRCPPTTKPLESLVANPLYHQQTQSRRRIKKQRPDNPYATLPTMPAFPTC